jgi:integrase
MGCVYRRNRTYWIKYYRHGKQYAESTNSDKITVAKRLLKAREGEIADGKIPRVCFDRIGFEEIINGYLSDYRVNGRKTIKKAEQCANLLLAEFKGMKATAINTTLINNYIEKRRRENAANATINRELSAMKRTFNLAAKCTPPKVAQVPYIPMLKENNVRKGFIEHEDYMALQAALPAYLKPVLTFAYLSGWRRSEIMELKWSQVNLREGIVRLEPGETKNGEGRTLYMEPELCEVLRELHRQRRMDCFYVFHSNGKKISYFRKSWNTACSRINRSGLLFHDLRRSAVRNMIRAGVPERVAMTISGHKTRSVFDRYNIVSQDDLKEAAKKRQAFSETQTKIAESSYKLVTIGSKNSKRLQS